MIEPLLQAERLLLHGMVEQAEQIYRRVAEQDPRNSIAVVGLARVCLERGDDEAALRHARAALVIDPENAAAARLQARLSEVLGERAQQAAAQAGPQLPVIDGPSVGSSEAQPWASTSPGQPSAPIPSPEARPSEQAVFTRNPSMADHRGQAPGEQPATDRTQPGATQEEPTAKAAPEQPRGLLSRLLRRIGGK